MATTSRTVITIKPKSPCVCGKWCWHARVLTLITGLFGALSVATALYIIMGGGA